MQNPVCQLADCPSVQPEIQHMLGGTLCTRANIFDWWGLQKSYNSGNQNVAEYLKPVTFKTHRQCLCLLDFATSPHFTHAWPARSEALSARSKRCSSLTALQRRDEWRKLWLVTWQSSCTRSCSAMLTNEHETELVTRNEHFFGGGNVIFLQLFSLSVLQLWFEKKWREFW